MSETQFLDQVQADRLFTQRALFRLRLYLMELGCADFVAYYAPDRGEADRAICLLPSSLLIRDPDRYAPRDLRLASDPGNHGHGPFVLKDGEAGVVMRLEGADAVATYAAATLDRLLRAGEERVFVNDREGSITAADLAAPAARLGLDPERLFADLVAEQLIGPDGVVTTRRRRVIQSLDSKEGSQTTVGLRLWLAGDTGAARIEESSIETAVHRRDAGAVKVPEPLEAPGAFLSRGLREFNPVAREYGRGAGLFNFDRAGLNFTAWLGRGEHNVFFEYLIGNRYGHFMPYSFTDAARNPERSLDIYRELVEREILDSRGRLSDIRRLAGLDCLAGPEGDAILDAVRDVLRQARETGLQDLRNQLKYDRSVIVADLQASDLEYDYDGVRRFVADTAHDDHPRFVAAYQESRIHQEINAEAAKNRGIVLGATDGAPRYLLLITDGVQLSAPYYAFLLEEFRERLGGAPGDHHGDIRIAHAYHAPTPRNPRKFPHPIVHALQMMKRETTPDLRPATSPHHELDSSS
ncbi:MAG: hypothetical protein RIF32_21730 [Leptospirales bacterium]